MRRHTIETFSVDSVGSQCVFTVYYRGEKRDRKMTLSMNTAHGCFLSFKDHKSFSEAKIMLFIYLL